MSNVGKAGPAVGPPPGAGQGDGHERAPKAGEFEAVLREKDPGTARAEPPARGRAEDKPSEGRGRESRATDGRAVDRAVEGRPGDRSSEGAEAGRSRGPRGGAEAPSGEREGGEAGGWRALPGDVAVPARREVAAAVVETSRAADAVARVERIAEQIVRGVEVRLGPGGAGEVRLELDLGALGQLRVALHRDAEGTLAVRFDRAGPEASRLLVDQGGDLVSRLEAKGLALREVVVAGADGSLVRVGSPSGSAPEELASRLADTAVRREQASSRQPEDERRRGRRDPAIEEEEEG